jgi:hypothetical protein
VRGFQLPARPALRCLEQRSVGADPLTAAALLSIIVLNVYNDRLRFGLNKTLGAMTELSLDGVDLLGPTKGRTGMGYFDGYW